MTSYSRSESCRRWIGARYCGKPKPCADHSPGPKLKPGDPPTPRQRELLDAMVLSQEVRGVPMTIREMALVLGVSSTNAVADLLSRLERRGLVRRAVAGGASRAWIVARGEGGGAP